VHKCQNKNQSKYFQICRNYWVFFPNALDTGKKNNNKRKQISFCLAVGLLSLYVESFCLAVGLLSLYVESFCLAVGLLSLYVESLLHLLCLNLLEIVCFILETLHSVYLNSCRIQQLLIAPSVFL
jgi:hypothetical protein